MGLCVLLASPYLIGAGIIACVSPGIGVLVAVGALVGLGWVMGMARSGDGN